MELLKLIADNSEWFGQNFAHNLDFIPDDKLNWSPAPSCKAPLDITAEVVKAFGFVRAYYDTPEEKSGWEAETPETREEAKAQILKFSKMYADFLRSLSPADLEGTFETRFGPYPKERMIQMPVQDLIHHHGQLAYLQTMWGDTNSHFFEFGT